MSRFTLTMLALLRASVAVSALEAGKLWQWQHLVQYEEHLASMRARDVSAVHELHKKRQIINSPFKNNETEKFSVDGTKLPDIDFDIGESYAGLLPISNSSNEASELFFWFFPSTDGAVKDEIIVWFTGGPGCSSLSGLFEENGPVTWKPGTFGPVPNPWSWHHLSHVVWIEQPIGTGYATGSPTYKNEDELAQQFMGFWKNFVDTFGTHNYSVYITGESYAGMYCPYVASNMLDAKDSKYFNVSGMLIYDGVYVDVPMGSVITVPFVDSLPGLLPFNESFVKDIHKRHEDCKYAEYLEEYLVYPPSGQQPVIPPGINENQSSYLSGCGIMGDVMEAIFDLNPCFNIYQVGAGCPLPYDPLGFSAGYDYNPEGAPVIYFNRTDVKAALHAPPDSDWALCKNDVFIFGDDSPGSSLFAIPNVIDKTQNVMLVHGALDMVLMMNGTLLAIQNMTWGGKLGFQKVPSDPLYVPYHENPSLGSTAGMGIYGTAHTERGLTFAAVTLSGHMVPANQPSVAYRQLEVLLGRVDNLQSQSPFTTDTNSTAQPKSELGSGTGPQIFAVKDSNNSGSCGKEPGEGDGTSAGVKAIGTAMAALLPMMLMMLLL